MHPCAALGIAAAAIRAKAAFAALDAQLAQPPAPPANSVRDVKAFLSELNERGIALKHWAAHHQFRLADVYAVVNGRFLGKRGKARAIMLAMGLAVPPQGEHTA